MANVVSYLGLEKIYHRSSVLTGSTVEAKRCVQLHGRVDGHGGFCGGVALAHGWRCVSCMTVVHGGSICS